jgi:hypothetical protein
MHDYTALDLSPRLEAILNYATLLAREPSAVQEDDLYMLRKAGLSDEEILSVALITCNFSFMTRLADGLGVELDDRLRDKARTFVRSTPDANEPNSGEPEAPVPESEAPESGSREDRDWLHRGKASRGVVISGAPTPDA